MTSYVSIAEDSKGPWKICKLEDELYDPGLFFDDDGKVYVVHGQGTLFISELKIVDDRTGELSIVSKKEAGERRNGKKIYQYADGEYNEGSHVYKRDGYYYILSTPTWKHGSKKEIAIRTKNLLYGPYEAEDIITSFMNFSGNGIHQGGIVDVPQEEGKESQWWTIIFQDRGKIGRVPTLQPVFWKNGWPYMGQLDGEKAVITYQKPHILDLDNVILRAPKTSDHFDSNELGLQWQWNHNPDNNKWSLKERKGFIRLKTASVTSSLVFARNTLTQRIVGPDCIATVKVDINHMIEGDIAGLCVMQKYSNYIGIEFINGIKNIIIYDFQEKIVSKVLLENITDIWLRGEIPRYQYKVEFSYSLDGEHFIKLGGRYDMHYGTYVGMRFGIFNFATIKLGGYIDVDSFLLTTSESNGNLFHIDEKIDAERYDDQKYVSDKELVINAKSEWTNDDVFGGYKQCIANLTNGDWLRYDQIDFKNGEAKWFNARLSSCETGGTITVKVEDSEGNPGDIIAILDIPNIGHIEQYINVLCSITKKLIGKQRIFLVFDGSDKEICKLNWFMFSSKNIEKVPDTVIDFDVIREDSSVLRIDWDEVIDAIQYDIKVNEEISSNVTRPFYITNIIPKSAYTVQIRTKNFAGYSVWGKTITI